MSLASLLSAYGGPSGDYADAVEDGDEVAITRIRQELAQAIHDELVPAMLDRILTGVQLNDAIEAYAIIFPDRPAMAATVTDNTDPHVVTMPVANRVKQMANHTQILAAALAHLRGETPSVQGATNPTEAIAAGTRVYAVFEGPVEYINWPSKVVGPDLGDDPIVVAPIDLEDGEPTYEVPREHVWFEYKEAQIDLGTAEFMDALEVGTEMTDGVDTWPIASINYTTRMVVLTATPDDIELSFEDLMADWTAV